MKNTLIVLYMFVLYLYSSPIYAGSIDTKKTDNPLKVHTYKLSNGLTIYLNEDHNTTSVFGAVVVSGGGKRDPKDATGIAHYLEHLLFKGTEKMGTTNYLQEKVYLDSIEIKYENLAHVVDENEKNKLQTDINRLSIKASEYAIPNEFDRLIEQMGGSWINAFTSNDAIVYLNKFPGNQMEKWLETYSHRFINPVFRLFQSELETVYEEKNRSMDSPFGQTFELYSKHFFKNHPYGQQTILGSVEHLKTPSLSKMKEYFNTYYVANNMALILTGDINLDETIAMIKEKFSRWESGKLPDPINIMESEFKGREFLDVNMTPIKMGVMGFRAVPAGHKDEIALELAIRLLTNESKTGLIDFLEVEGKVRQTGIYNMSYVDHGGVSFFFFPLDSQSLQSAEDLVNNQVEKLKNGSFDDNFLNAVKVTMMRQHEESIESMEGRLFNLMDIYIKKSSWENIISWPKRLEHISKEDVMAVANKYFGENYFALHSNEGISEKHKLEKPSFQPVIPKNTEEYSDFGIKINNIPEGKFDLHFIEFNDDVKHLEISKNINLYHTNNPINSIFNLSFQYGIGNFQDPKLEQTAELLNLLGTENHTFNELKGELQQIGTTISFNSTKDYFTINVKGFDKHLNQSLKYLKELMTNIKGDDEKIKILIDNAKSKRKVENENPSIIGRAIRDFATFGDQSYYLYRLSVDDIEKFKASDYIESFHNALKYEVDIFYTGEIALNTISETIKKTLTLSNNPLNSNSPIDLEMKSINENLIYLINDTSMVQSQIYFNINGNVTNDKLRTQAKAYNKYFSGGMSSIVFQEIREFRSLAYSSWASYSMPFYNGSKGMFIGYIGCQTDKTLEAISVFKDITINMPKKTERLEQVKSSLIKSINTDRPSFRRYPRMISRWKKMGYNDDPRKEQVNYFKTMSFDEIINFQKNNIANKPMIISILTDQNRINIDELIKYGKIIILEKKDVLN